MSYQKHTWVTEEIIRGKHLNNIEDGIYNEEQRAMAEEEDLWQNLRNEVNRAVIREDELEADIVANTNAIDVLNGDSTTAGSVDYKVAELEDYVLPLINSNTSAIAVLNDDDTVEGSVDYKIKQALGNAGGYKITLDHTQEVDPSTKYIYLEKDTSVVGQDKYEEWIYVYYESTDTYQWEMIGEVSLDLSGYVQNTDYASTSVGGVVKIDGSSILIDANGTISAHTSGGIGSVVVEHVGTASDTSVRYQRVNVDGTYYEVDGSKYMETTMTTSTSADVTVTFTSNEITANSLIDIYTTQQDLNYDTLTIAAGSCAVTYGKQASAETVSVRIYIRG